MLSYYNKLTVNIEKMQNSRFSFACLQSDNDNNSIKNIIESFLSIESREYFNLSLN